MRTTDEEEYIRRKIESLLARLFALKGQYVHVSKKRYSSFNRGEIYARTKEALGLMGIPFEEKKGNHHGTYKIKIVGDSTSKTS